MRFEEWASSYQPADEESARDAWNGAIEAASKLKPRAVLTDKQRRELVQLGGSDAWVVILTKNWEAHQRRIRTLRAKVSAE